MNRLDNLIFYSSKVFLSEDQNNPDSYIAKFIICDFSRNGNGVALNRDTAETWIQTLKNKPLVGKITMRYDGTYDFTGHNVKVIKKIDKNGKEYQEAEFNTEAFGTFFDVGIEIINETEYIVASCEIWKRFTKACEIIVNRIQTGTLNTSWEISTTDASQGIVDGLMTKIINTGRFIGHCLLGKNVTPAYQSSGLVEIASTSYDIEFSEALSDDLIANDLNKENEEGGTQEIMGKNKTEISEEIKNEEEKTPEVAQLTEYDLRKKLREACRSKLNDWCYISFHFPNEKEIWVEKDSRESELDYVKFTYTVENDEVSISEPEDVKLTVSVAEINVKMSELETEISTKDDALVKASGEITSLKTEVSNLQVYKEKFEVAEQEKLQAEQEEKKEALIASITKSKLITKEEIESSSELKAFVDSFDEKSLKAIVAERFMATLDSENKEEKIETATSNMATASTNLNNVEDEIDTKSIMRSYLGGK